jgi:antitoxin component YwqK of YwqJK toxin-antitoxin module
MKNLLLLILCFILFLGCKSKPINQKINKLKEGAWMDNYTQDSTNYKSFEFYKHDIPVKKWKSYINGKIYKTEKYKNGICIVKYYYENGKVQSKGKTRIVTDSIQTHWFYFGDWKFYSDKGKLTQIKNYKNGELISERKIDFEE